MLAGVLEPELDVRRRVDDLALHDERVAVVGRPSRRAARASPPPAGITQLASTWHQPPVGEVVGRGAHDVLDDAVAGQAGVAVDQPLAGRRAR